jgi:excisionase family DNA binding protein
MLQMSIKLKKLHCIIDQPPTHMKLVLDWSEEQSTAFLYNEILQAIKPADSMQEEEVEIPLFDKNNLAKIIEEVGYHERLIIFLRPRYKLERIIVEPDEVIMDVHHSDGERLAYSFYNPTKRSSISIAAKISEDIDGVYRKIAASPMDLQLQQYFIKRATEQVSFESEPKRSLPELMTVPQVSEYLQLEEKTIRNWVAGKQIPFKKVGSAVRFKKTEIDKALDGGTLGKVMAKKVERKSVTTKRKS